MIISTIYNVSDRPIMSLIFAGMALVYIAYQPKNKSHVL